MYFGAVAKKNYSKYALYEASVQSAKEHIDWLVKIFHEMRGRYPSVLREDFCGTFLQAVEWVKRNRNNIAIGVDLDSEPLRYGKRVHQKGLTTEQKKRVELKNADVTTVKTKPADIILAGNFSFYTLRSRDLLVRYLKNCYRSLKPGGFVFLEMAGGPGMIEKIKERRSVRGDGKTTPKKMQYVWDQKEFDPIQNRGQYAIHFYFPNGKKLRDVFTYDWRVWSIPEVRDAMRDAGFEQSVVFWEQESKGEGTGEYLPMNTGDNAYSWVGYVLGLKKTNRHPRGGRK